MIIHAVSIHSGGGKVLLDQLLIEETFGKVQILICDTRYVPPRNIDPRIKMYLIEPTLISRWRSEFLLKSLCKLNPHLQIFCFSNLPPAFKLHSKVILYLQNALLLPNVPLYGEGLKVKLRILYEKIWLNFFFKNVDEIWVQTISMKQALYRQRQSIFIKPIYPTLPQVDFDINKEYDFITITGPAPHKRLAMLLEAWELFPDDSPRLLIITDRLGDDLNEKLEKIRKKNVEVVFEVSRDEIYSYYQKSKCLIVTSEIESFCLPLYEAHHFHLKALGPNEPYVNDFGKIDGILNMESKFKLKESLDENLLKINDQH